MIYLLVEGMAGRARFAELKAALGDPGTAALNSTTFDGGRLDLGEVAAACEAMPFLAPRRLVILRGALPKGRGDGPALPRSRNRGAASPDTESALAEYLRRVPETTNLVLMEPELPSGGSVMTSIQALVSEGRAEIVRETPLDPASAPAWVRDQARSHGSSIEGEAAAALVDAVGLDRRALTHEVEKLSLAAEGRMIGLEDVRSLVRAVDTARIFELVDAIGGRNPRTAVRTWRVLLRSGDDAHRMLTMVARQFRLLLQISEMRGASPTAVASALALHPRAAAGLVGQARGWTSEGLRDVYERLVEMDHESKIGGADLEGALESLIAELVAARR